MGNSYNAMCIIRHTVRIQHPIYVLYLVGRRSEMDYASINIGIIPLVYRSEDASN